MKYNPSDAAKACNVSVNTIRGWIRDRGESGNKDTPASLEKPDTVERRGERRLLSRVAEMQPEGERLPEPGT